MFRWKWITADIEELIKFYYSTAFNDTIQVSDVLETKNVNKWPYPPFKLRDKHIFNLYCYYIAWLWVKLFVN